MRIEEVSVRIFRTTTRRHTRTEWFERGLLHLFLEYDDGYDYLNGLYDPMDSEGFVHLSDRPGLGLDFAFIDTNLAA
jgi:hypothetical protein